MIIVYFTFLASLLPTFNTRPTVTLNLSLDDEDRPLTLAFGSCYRILDLKNNIFDVIGQNRPHLWTWMGDAAYTDNVLKAQWVTDNSMDLAYIKSRFDLTRDDPVYARFANKTPVIGVWDDHDIGCNNADKTFSKKKDVRDMFLDFIGEPEGTARRTEKDTGVY